ncbi:UNVERIFIED_ORG: hypothetical protein ABIB52_004157 [Arthrobacter sp. UYCu721]
MRDAEDLVTVRHKLRQLINVKGTERSPECDAA